MILKKYVMLIVSVLCMLMMIPLSGKISDGAREGIQLCLHAVIPALFPFFVVSAYLNGQLSDRNFAVLRPIEKICGMPANSGSIFLLGLIGGYPVGAQSIAQWHENGAISTQDANRLLGFCNNAGPAFIFGILSAFFPSQWDLWALWLIQIMSAFFTAMILPRRQTFACKNRDTAPVPFTQALERSVRSILLVCGWVIVFRIIISFYPSYPRYIKILLCGITELTNGCMQLNEIASAELRFIAASVFLTFGGFCVHMQSVCAAKDLRLSSYITGKLIQTIISAILAILITMKGFLCPLILFITAVSVSFLRKNSSISKANVIQ